jgi:hypothetical protein
MKKKLSVILALTLTALLSSCGGGKATLHFENATLESFYVSTSLSSMRPCAASSDGKTVYVGFIKSGDPLARGIGAISVDDGSKTEWIYNPGYTSYTKGVAADDRGYVYVGIAQNPSENYVIIDILSKDGKKAGSLQIDEAGEFGVNGLTVEKIGNAYTLYIITNYGPNRVYSYDVTDVTSPKLNTGFSTNGYAPLKALSNNTACEANYLKADGNGNLYITANLGGGSKGDSILKLSSNGTKLEKLFEVKEAYGIDLAEGYFFVSTYQGASSHVYVYNQTDYTLVKDFTALDGSNNYAGVVYASGRLYVTDQTYGTGSRLLRTSSLL